MEKFIDLSGVILPALILLLGLIRVLSRQSKGINTAIMILAVLLLVAGVARYIIPMGNNSTYNDNTKDTPLTVSKHSNLFNQSLDQVLKGYYKLTAAFSSEDLAQLNQASQQLQPQLDSFKLSELMKDTLIFETALQPYENLKSELASIIADPSMAEKKASFNIFSNELFTLLKIVRYDVAKLYWLECDHSFGEGNPGNWISVDETTANPYGQKDCKETKTTINFVPSDSTKLQ